MDFTDIRWDRIREIIRVDLITMRGGKGNMKLIVIIFAVFMLLCGFFISSLASLYLPFMLGAFFVPMIFQNEIKYRSDKLWGLLPIRRKDLVDARFLLAFGIFTGVNLAFYLFMLLSMKLKLWRFLMEGDDVDVLAVLADSMGFTRLGFFNLAFFVSIAVGMFVMSGSLRKYFRSVEAFDAAQQWMITKRKKDQKKDILPIVLIVGFFLLWVLLISGMLPAVKPVMLLLGVVLQLVNAANGVLLAVVFLTFGVLKMLCSYVATQIEYSRREL